MHVNKKTRKQTPQGAGQNRKQGRRPKEKRRIITTAFASEVPEEEVKVVEMVEYDENMDEFASEMVIEWRDGNRYVLDEATHMVTIYDADGNVISVCPQ